MNVMDILVSLKEVINCLVGVLSNQLHHSLPVVSIFEKLVRGDTPDGNKPWA